MQFLDKILQEQPRLHRRMQETQNRQRQDRAEARNNARKDQPGPLSQSVPSTQSTSSVPTPSTAPFQFNLDEFPIIVSAPSSNAQSAASSPKSHGSNRRPTGSPKNQESPTGGLSGAMGNLSVERENMEASD